MTIGPGAQIALENTQTSPSGASSRGSHRLAAAGGGCKRQFALSYIKGLRPRYEPEHRLIGTLVHNCIAYHYAAKLAVPPSWFTQTSLDDALLKDARHAPDLIRLAKNAALAYAKRWAGEPWVPYSVETEYKATLGELDPDGPFPELNDEVITCRSDLIVESNGELWIVDHKCSAGQWGKDYLEPWKDDGEYRMSWQAMVNLMIVRKRLSEVTSKPVSGFVINRVKRREPFDFDRHVLHMPLLAYAQAPRVARMFVREELRIYDDLAHGIKPTPNFSSCFGRYGSCDYINICAAESEDAQNRIMDMDFVQIGGGH